MAFRKTMKAEKVEAVLKDESEAIRKLVKEAGVKSAAELTDEQRSQLVVLFVLAAFDVSLGSFSPSDLVAWGLAAGFLSFLVP